MVRLLVAALLLAMPVAAQQSAPSPVAGGQPRPVLRATDRHGEIRIDGKLDEEAWTTAPVYSEFRQLDPSEGQPGSERTDLRILYDRDAIYLGLRMHDSDPSGIRSRLARRDEPIFGADLVEVYLDTYLDRLTGFVFRITPAGAIRDAAWLAPGSGGFGQDNSWDAVWQSGARVDSGGWTAELRIPFSQLRYNVGAADTTWGIQVRRDVARKGETMLLAFTPKHLPSGPQAWADLTGLQGLPKSRSLELLPYVTARAEYLDVAPGNPFRGASEYKTKFGGDLRYSLTSSMRLSATVNPDFGQVEVDPARVNLSANELFFPERRPFFIEGADIFRYGRIRSLNSYAFPTFFHSRRIGRAPQRGVSGQAYVDAPDEATIAGAVKLTGKTAGGLSLGVLDAVTTRETARFAGAGGQRGTEPVEPMTNYLVGRAQQNYRQGNTTVGALLTAVNRDLEDAPLAALLRRDSYFAGMDVNHSWKQREWSLDASLARSSVFGTPAAIARTQLSSVHYFQRPDLESDRFDPNRRSLHGTAWQIAGAKNSGEHWVGSATYQGVSPGFEVNDVGFHSLTAYRAFSTVVQYKEDKPGNIFRQYSLGPFNGYNTNTDGDKTEQYHGFHVEGRLRNFWQFTWNTVLRPQAYDDRRTRGGPAMVNPASRSIEIDLTTDSRRIYVIKLEYDHFTDDEEGRSSDYGLDFNIRPTSSLRISFSPRYEDAVVATQYITQAPDPTALSTFGRRYVFGSLRYHELSLQSRVDWTFSPRLSLQMFVQPLIATGAYSDFRSLRYPKSREFDRFSIAGGTLVRTGDSYTVRPAPGSNISFGDPDFHDRALLGNAVVRWEYRPGSALFFVWQQRRAGEGPPGNFEFGRDVSGVLRTAPENVFAIKATYWIGR
ncbi:MAG TPA: DUF5916 domain-containing protein [Gemmatimonadaceae bacterium]|nr:DUF5916 domain-containing protein [Gemmatimonadaceae bacterium]